MGRAAGRAGPVLSAAAPPPAQVRTQFRKIFTQMGFEEMPTNNYGGRAAGGRAQRCGSWACQGGATPAPALLRARLPAASRPRPPAPPVESSFWNFDALFQPQQHPARDAHDTFFLTHPATSDEFPDAYLQRVKVCVF